MIVGQLGLSLTLLVQGGRSTLATSVPVTGGRVAPIPGNTNGAGALLRKLKKLVSENRRHGEASSLASTKNVSATIGKDAPGHS